MLVTVSVCKDDICSKSDTNDSNISLCDNVRMKSKIVGELS